MSTQIINYLHKVQGIDKVVPLLFVLKQLEPQLKVHTVLDIERTSLNAVPQDLFASLRQLSESCSSAPTGWLYSFLRRYEGIVPRRVFRLIERMVGPDLAGFF